MIKSLIALILFAACAWAQGPSPVDSLYLVAQLHYENGDFDLAELSALRGLRSAAGLDEFEQLKYHALLGFVYVAKEQNESAIQEFMSVLAVNPRYEPGPVTTSPKILEVFRQAKADYMLRVASEPAVYRMPQADVRLAASWRSLVAPGWGQVFKEQKVKAAVVVAAQVLSLAALVYMQTEVNRRHDDYLALKLYGDPNVEDRYQEFRRAYRTRNVVGYIALGIYLGNSLDALYVPVGKK
jgi:tetratricopeptide (TPR) repeat protein